MQRRKATAVIAALVVSPLSGCGGDSSDDTPATTTPPSTTPPTPTPPTATPQVLKVAYESSRNLSTGWTDDGSVIAVGRGDFRSSTFVVQYGQLSNGTDKIGFTIESPTKCTYYSSDNAERIVVDRTDPTLITVRFYRNGVFSNGWAFYSQGGQTYVGIFTSESTPSIADLTDVRPVTVKTVARATTPMTFLARLFNGVIKEAKADEISDAAAAVGNSVYKFVIAAVPFVAAGAAFYFCPPGWKLACAIGAFTVTSIVFNSVLASASENPPRVYSKALPPAGSIPYGEVIYVDDGGCPAGQIKQVTGGNQAQGIPRRIVCVPLPATIP